MGLHSSVADEKNDLFWVPKQLQSFWHVEPLSVSEWDFIHQRHVEPLSVSEWESVNETSFICGSRKRNNWLRDACVDRPGNTTTKMTSTLLRRPWPPSLSTGQARGTHRES